MVTKGEQLFALVERLVPALEVDEKRSAAACSPEIYAAREASRLAAEGTPFRDAYGRIAQQLQDGSFKVDNAGEETSNLHLEEVTAAIARSQAWIADRRQSVTATIERLFDWK
jgi:argininosuccinate lyase